MLRPWELHISIDTTAKKAVYIQIADAIITAISKSQLKSGDALPGSRTLAKVIGVNRNTIVQALEVALAEGWLIAKERQGIFVAEKLPDFKNQTKIHKPNTIAIPSASDLLIFDDGFPDSRLAPMNELARAYRQIFGRKARWQMMGYTDPLGDPEFRNALRQMLSYKRGMEISEDQICITRGSQMAMYLSAHTLFEPGDYVMVENPGYKPAWQVFQNAGAQLIPIPVDSEGLCVEAVKDALKQHPNIRALYTTPHHQYPTTVTLTLQRRTELIQLSNSYGFTIIEDDYDHEFHFGHRPILPLCSFPGIENYIYMGTLSKIVAPALRIGYLISSREQIQKVATLRRLIDVQGDTIMEKAVLQLIQDGEIKRHLKRATVLYKNKRDYFEQVVQHYLGDKVHFTKPEGGLAFWLVPNEKTDSSTWNNQLLEQKFQIILPDKFSYAAPVNGLRLGYASLTESQLEEGARAIATLF